MTDNRHALRERIAEIDWQPLTPKAIDELASSGAPFFGGLWVHNRRTGTRYFEVSYLCLSERETDEGASYFVPQTVGVEEETGWDLEDYEYFIPFDVPQPPQDAGGEDDD